MADLYNKQRVASSTGVIMWEDKPDSIPQVIRTNVSNYNLVPTKKTILVTFIGTSTVFNLPPVAVNVGTIIILYNGGTLDAVIKGNSADGNVVIDGGMTTTSTNLTSGSPMTIYNDGFNWITKP